MADAVRMSRLLTTLVLLVLAAGAHAQPLPIAWTASAEPASAAPGDLVTLTVRGTLDPGWRLYAMDSRAGRPLQVRFTPPRAFEPLGTPQQAQPREGYDQWFESDYTYFVDEATVTQAFRVARAASGGETRLAGEVTFMVCNDEVCLPPRTQEVAVRVAIDAPVTAEAAAPPDARAPPPDEPTPAEQPLDSPLAESETEGQEGPDDADVEAPLAQTPPAGSDSEAQATFDFGLPAPGAGRAGLWAFLLLAVGAGLAALLTPCVFPMIPLTVSFFLHQSGNRRRAVRMASVYGISIVGIFTGLGLAMALVVGAAGPTIIATNPWVNLFIGAVLVVFGFSLLGFYELRLPGSWLNYFNRQGNERGGYVGVLFMGFTLTLVSFSCTVPFVGALLAQAVRSEWMYPILGMVVFSTVFALPFVAFALFPRALNRLPKSGSWMTGMKGLLGFVEIAAALKFLSNADLVWGLGVLPRPLAIALMIVIFALAGFFLLDRLALRTPEGTLENAPARPMPVGPFRLVAAIACFGLSLYMVPGLLGAPLGGIDAFLPPHRATDVSLVAAAGAAGGSAPAGHEGWLQDREEAFAAARQRGMPVLIDFTGYTCTNCRYMEANVLSRPAIAERIREHFVPLQLWTDDGRMGPELQRYQFELTGRIALPTYAVVTPDGALMGQLSGVASVDRFAAFLDQYTPAGQPLAAR
jgi:thiol:disulfide interchange protein